MKVAHFFHAWAAGDWQTPVGEHLAALDCGGFDGPVTVGLVGPIDQQTEIRRWFEHVRSGCSFIEADNGWEQVTLDAIHAHAREHDGAVLYAHTKGAAHPGPWQHLWRQWMTRHLVTNWRQCAQLLDEVDAVGCHWLTPEEYPDRGFKVSHFGGNFWMARCDYLRRLPQCRRRERHDAEAWIGLADPRVMDLLPGWPPPALPPPLSVGRLVVPL